MEIEILDRLGSLIDVINVSPVDWKTCQTLIDEALRKEFWKNAGGADVMIGSVKVVSEKNPAILEDDIPGIPAEDFIETSGGIWVLEYEHRNISSDSQSRRGVVAGASLSMVLLVIDVLSGHNSWPN